ncbi:MAG: VacJ family lipoprotein [Nitrospira sp.]|nr:VacJ family lipoprotein [Nitrospira sp.]MBP6605350.1 VacJ family lipoprotein [Nitrospira sp.]HQY57323.1 VacJ family lipoprotein [Nitrospira sp.]HRA96853.1 VacJ family lipoprotein [Nitrospira sp.]
MVHRIGVGAGRFLEVVSAVVLLMVVGCAGGPPRPTLTTGAGVESLSVPEYQTDGGGTATVDTTPLASPHAALAEDKQAPSPVSEPTVEPAEDPFFDPFAKSDEPAGGEEYDPWEPVNTKVFEFNRLVDRWVLKPVAQGYNAVMPNPVQIGIGNVFYNIRFPSRLINNLAQGKLSGAGTEVGRFLLNSTFGLGGLVDVAKYMNITTPEEDTGQTLGYYGMKPGPYVVLPLLPPFTLRDLVGFVGDIALNPINWMVFPIIEINGIPSLVAHHNRTTSSIAQIGSRVGEILNDRSLNLEKFQGVEEATLDLYTAVKNAYIQKRRNQIRE